MPLLKTMTDITYFIHVFIEKVEKKQTESMPTNTHDFILLMTKSSTHDLGWVPCRCPAFRGSFVKPIGIRTRTYDLLTSDTEAILPSRLKE